MKQEQNKTYLQKVAENYRKGSMLNLFYLFLAKKKKEVKNKNGK